MIHVKNFLSNNFEMKDTGDASYVIGIKVPDDKSQGLLGLSQNHLLIKYKRNSEWKSAL